jgi:hypothetical protein
MSEDETQLHHELLALIQKHTPSDKNAPLAAYLPGFTSLRLLLIQQIRSTRDDELLKSVLASYQSYKKGGRSETEIASMTARDFMLLSKQSSSALPRNPSERTNVVAPPQQHQHQPLQYQLLDADAPHLASILMGLPGQAVGGPSSTNNVMSNGTQVARQLPVLSSGQHNSSGDNNNVDGDSALLHFAMGSHSYGQEYNTSLGVSPALHPITRMHLMGSPTHSSHEQLPSLGVSPALHSIASQPDGASGLGPLGLSASQMSALLQDDAAMNFQGL